MTMEQNDTLTDKEIYALAEKALENYAFESKPNVELICRSENATLRVTTQKSIYALRIHRPNYHSKRAIESELLWLDAIRESGIAVPLAVKNNDGGCVNRVDIGGSSSRYAVLFEWIDGAMPTTDTDPESFEHLGEIMARLHVQSINWQRPDGFERIVWDHDGMIGKLGHWGDWRSVPGLSTEDQSIIELVVSDIAERMKLYGKSKQTFGLIHADLRLTNLLMHDSGTRVIDFDDSGLGWFMHDAAATISFYEHYECVSEWIENWLKGYQRIRPLTQTDLDILPVMIMQRRIQLLAWVGSHQYTDMAKSLGSSWVGETVSLCKKYLDDQTQLLSLAG